MQKKVLKKVRRNSCSLQNIIFMEIKMKGGGKGCSFVSKL
jgi:hypothetical protein